MSDDPDAKPELGQMAQSKIDMILVDPSWDVNGAVVSDELTPAQAAAVQLNMALSGDLLVWTIYASPKDLPDKFVARPHSVRRQVPLRCHLAADTLENIRSALPPGLVQMSRDPTDDPVIVECWI
jgi:hypothetical protein